MKKMNNKSIKFLRNVSKLSWDRVKHPKDVLAVGHPEA